MRDNSQTHGESVALAVQRAENMRTALGWLQKNLEEKAQFQSAFQIFLEHLKACRRPFFTNRAKEGNRPEVTGQVHFTAIGKSGDVARLLVSMLASVGIRASFLHPTEALHGDLGAVFPGDTVILLSNKGESSELLQLLPLLKTRQVKRLAITAVPDSPLGRQAEWVLPIPLVREHCAHEHAPVTSTVVTLALGQLLVAGTMDHGELDLESYAHNHPGGAIGRRIFLKVADIMVPFLKLPLVKPETPFAEAISVMTERAFGVILVAQGEELRGIVTERDLRKAMEKFGPSIFEKVVEDFMNPAPILIQENTLAIEALKIMENRENPLNFLIVCQEDPQSSTNRVRGLLRLHDAIQAGLSLSQHSPHEK